jgi:urease accessory protein
MEPLASWRLGGEKGARGLHGHLDIVCGPDARGVSVLRRQSFSAPVHLSKPHHDAGVLVVNVVNPTAGWLGGDRIDVRVAVEGGAALALTAPSASRAHRTRDGARAEVVQDFHVAAGGSLESWPELLIPQGGSRCRLRTRAVVEPGGELLYFDLLAPGRVAHGENLAFTELAWDVDVLLGARQIARERNVLAPGSPALATLTRVFPAPYYASALIVSPHLREDAPCWARIHALHTAEAHVGCGALVAGGWVVKVLAGSAPALRRTMGAVRREIYYALGRPAPALRRAEDGFAEHARVPETVVDED